MYGKYLRTPLQIFAAVLTALVLEFGGGYLLPYLKPTNGSAGYLYNVFDFLINNALFLMVIAILLGVLARAVVERRAAGGVR